jgi:hypothetical protein
MNRKEFIKKRGEIILKAIEQSNGTLIDIKNISGLSLASIYRYYKRFEYIRMIVLYQRMKCINAEIKELKNVIKKRDGTLFKWNAD